MFQYKNLNVDQQRAVRQVIEAEDYALIWGMPGTGKTSTIAFIIKILVERGKTILLTSYTHTAVDALLLKLNSLKVPFLRLGKKENIHPSLQPHSLSHAGVKTTKELQSISFSFLILDLLDSRPVVATTCLGITHPVLSNRHFDYCVVDEAAQITQPVCWGPLRFADVFVLVGDHNQVWMMDIIYPKLPPLIRNEEAKLQGMEESLFKTLSDKFSQAVVSLEFQYRMNEDIMLLSNTLVYNFRLRCGTEEVGKVIS